MLKSVLFSYYSGCSLETVFLFFNLISIFKSSLINAEPAVVVNALRSLKSSEEFLKEHVCV